MSVLIDQGEKALEYALKMGADDAEVIVSKADILTINIESGDTRFGGEDLHKGLGLRVARNNSLGFAYTTVLTDHSITELVNRAWKVSKVMEPDPDFHGFPSPRKPSQVSGVYDKMIENLTPDTAKDYSKRIIEAGESLNDKITATFGVFESSTRSFAVLNSNDMKVESTGTYVSAGLRTLYDYGTGTSNGLGFQNSRHLKNMDPEWIGEKSSTLALMSKNPEKIKTKVSTIILDPDAVAGLLQGVLMNALYGDVVQKKSSFLYGKLGKKIGVNNLTIYDDGTLFDGWKTSSIDHEGVPMKKKTLIKEGILEGYLYDTYTANKENKESTGNAVRSGGFGPYHDPRGREYRFPPGIGCTNLVIKEGTMNRDSLIEDVRDGFIVTFAVGGGSSSSGDFSADARNVYKIENGEIAYPVRQAMYTGNLLDMFMNLEGLGDNTRSSGGLNPGEIYSPSIKISKGLMVGDL